MNSRSKEREAFLQNRKDNPARTKTLANIFEPDGRPNDDRLLPTDYHGHRSQSLADISDPDISNGLSNLISSLPSSPQKKEKSYTPFGIRNKVKKVWNKISPDPKSTSNINASKSEDSVEAGDTHKIFSISALVVPLPSAPPKFDIDNCPEVLQLKAPITPDRTLSPRASSVPNLKSPREYQEVNSPKNDRHSTPKQKQEKIKFDRDLVKQVRKLKEEGSDTTAIKSDGESSLSKTYPLTGGAKVTDVSSASVQQGEEIVLRQKEGGETYIRTKVKHYSLSSSSPEGKMSFSTEEKKSGSKASGTSTNGEKHPVSEKGYKGVSKTQSSNHHLEGVNDSNPEFLNSQFKLPYSRARSGSTVDQTAEQIRQINKFNDNGDISGLLAQFIGPSLASEIAAMTRPSGENGHFQDESEH